MPVFTIRTTYRLPVYRHQTHEAATMEEACRLAVDDDWSDEKDPPYYVEKPQRIALHFEVLLGLVKALASQSDTERLDRTFWFERAQPAIAKAEAILVGGHEPD